jgi:hypothetical protein
MAWLCVRPKCSEVIWDAKPHGSLKEQADSNVVCVKPVKTEQDYQQLMQRITFLMDSHSGDYSAELDVLASLAVAYEAEHSQPACPSEVGGNIDPDFEEALDRIRTWPISQSYTLLFDFIKDCAWQDEFGKSSVSDADYGEVEYTFVTGGWSDNEEILEALKQQRLAWALTWQRSERGGKHVFRVKTL